MGVEPGPANPAPALPRVVAPGVVVPAGAFAGPLRAPPSVQPPSVATPVALVSDAPDIWYTSIRVGASRTLSSDPCQFLFDMSDAFVAAVMRGASRKPPKAASGRVASAAAASGGPTVDPTPQALGRALDKSQAMTAEMLYFDGRLPMVYCQERDELTAIKPPALQVDAVAWDAARQVFRVTVGVHRRLAPLSSSHGDQPFILAFRFSVGNLPVVVCRTQSFLVLRKQSASANALKKVHPNPFVPVLEDRAGPLREVQRGVLRPMRQGFVVSSRVMSGEAVASINPGLSDAGSTAASDGFGRNKRGRDDVLVAPAGLSRSASWESQDMGLLPARRAEGASREAEPQHGLPAKRPRQASGLLRSTSVDTLERTATGSEAGNDGASAAVLAMATAAVAEVERELAQAMGVARNRSSFEHAQSPLSTASRHRSAIVFEASPSGPRRSSVTPLLPVEHVPSSSAARRRSGASSDEAAAPRATQPRRHSAGASSASSAVSLSDMRGTIHPPGRVCAPELEPGRQDSGVLSPCELASRDLFGRLAQSAPSPRSWLASYMAQPVARRLASLDAVPGLLQAIHGDAELPLLEGVDLHAGLAQEDAQPAASLG